MKRLIPLLVPWMVLAGKANAVQVRTADVLYTYKDSIPQRGFRVGDECFVPLEEVSQFGWTAQVELAKTTLAAEGQNISVSTRTVNGLSCLAMRSVISQLGGRSQWRLGTDTLDVFDVLKQISVQNGHLLVSAKFNFKPYAFLLTNPNRAVIDLAGVRIGTDSETRITADKSVRVSQYKANTVRIVVEMPKIPLIPRDSILPSSEFSVDLNPAGGAEDTTESPRPDSRPNSEQREFGILNLKVDLESTSSTLILADLGPTFSGNAEFTKLDPSTVQIRLKHVQLALPENFKLNTQAVSRLDVSVQGPDTRLILSLKRPMGAEVSVSSGQLSIQLLRPDVGDGKLAGKVVVVDAGHGGHDSGTKQGQLLEKDMTLAIAKLLSRDLARSGAMVIMTRKTDEFIPLVTRADIANRNHADFFISCHINSNTGTTSGGITFHHKGNAVGRLLAECIQAQIAKVSGIPSLGAWSDGRIHQSGFSVLRNTKMPGVLVEFGFIDRALDRHRMMTESFRASVAQAIVQGLRNFLGDPLSGPSKTVEKADVTSSENDDKLMAPPETNGKPEE